MGYEDVRWSVDPTQTVALRFDDMEFVEALEDDERDEDSPLAQLLGVKHASEVDFAALVSGGVTIHARLGIPAKKADKLTLIAQASDRKQGMRYNAEAYNEAWFAAWVTKVTDEVSPTRVPADLSSPIETARGEAVGRLPDALRGQLFARLRVHVDKAGKPAKRDPKPSPGTAAD